MRINPFRVSILAGLLGILSAAQLSPSRAAENDLPSAIMTVIETDLRGFNTNNFALSNSQYVSDVVILDETPPYRWEGPGANARWWADFRKFAKVIKLTQWHFSFQKPTYWEVSNERAYVALPATFTGMAGGKPFSETGMETYLLVRVGNAWKTQGWAYAKTSEH